MRPPAMESGRDSRRASSPNRRRVVGIGELAVSNDFDGLLVTYALGSCVAVCLSDPGVPAAAMLHFLLPESAINGQRAAEQPAAFADTGIPLLLEAAAAHGLCAPRARIRLVGGAEGKLVMDPLQ